MTGTPFPVRTVLVAGGGTAGWMTTAALAHGLQGTGIAVRLVESAEIGTIGVGEATVPHIRAFNAALGFDEAEFMAATKATYKLGIELRNWGQVGDSYIHPFGIFGRPVFGAPFLQAWARLRQAGRAGNLDRWSVPVMAARQNRFGQPHPDPADLRSTYSYAFQFDASLYAGYLRAYAEARGVERIEGRIVDTETDAESRRVRQVVLDDGRTVEADLFVDCTGFRALLIEGVHAAGYESWSHWLPCDRAWAAPCRNVGPLTPYTRATAQQSGWTWRIPLQHRTGNGHVFSSGFISEDAALDRLLEEMGAEPLSEPRQLRFVPGKRRQQWVGNCVAIGLSAGFLEPLESTSIHLIQVGIEALLELFPYSGVGSTDSGEFNRRMALEYERVRDFVILHYAASQRNDSEMWRHVRHMALPDSLVEKMELYRARGIVTAYRHGLFQPPSWQALYAGQNIVPEHVDPRIADAELEELEAALDAIAADVATAAASLPMHMDILERYR